MIELPEAAVLTKQINHTLAGKKITNVEANHSPHKFAWFFGDSTHYPSLLIGKIIDHAIPYGGLLEIKANDVCLTFGDGVNLRYLSPGEELPLKHQLLITFEDGSSLVGSVQMYGGLWAFPEGQFDNPYYLTARGKPSPLTDDFNYAYFESLVESVSSKSMSAKAFLATEQRIPGLGNGVLQDILWNAKMHPKTKISGFSSSEWHLLFDTLKSVLNTMVQLGGRDTERDLFGQPGGYQTRLSKNTVNQPCPVCGTMIKKESYMGGSIYYCEGCQSL